MSNFVFASETANSLQNRLLEYLDSYFFLGGERTRILSIDSSGYGIAVRENVDVSTCVKILKILSFLFLPLSLIALALRSLLRANFKKTCRILYISSVISQQLPEKVLEHPTILKNALLNAPAGFFYVPGKYQNVLITQNDSGEISELYLSVNIERILDDLDLSSLLWGSSFVQSLYTYEGEESIELNNIFYTEHTLVDNSRLSKNVLGYASKRILAKMLLNQIFNKGMLNQGLARDPHVSADQQRCIFFDTQPKEGFSLFPDVFFNMQKIGDREKLGCGYVILGRLEKLGIQPTFVNEENGFSVRWGTTPSSDSEIFILPTDDERPLCDDLLEE
ncbi:Family of unknown function (DUF648) [Chlamydia serpentis]|uniref:Uncharacterized protein n=1 Tax=Chlamydia serpentis TaxID=1967782 RepID=A0A2R8FAV0_9CHLA|nr:DUF648 domain-containing protein [Chlamydia serpentis]SPN73553.1 Family of unknown function (DUF648) [Chlamydia serpentis]